MGHGLGECQGTGICALWDGVGALEDGSGCWGVDGEGAKWLPCRKALDIGGAFGEVEMRTAHSHGVVFHFHLCRILNIFPIFKHLNPGDGATLHLCENTFQMTGIRALPFLLYQVPSHLLRLPFPCPLCLSLYSKGIHGRALALSSLYLVSVMRKQSLA